MRRTLQNLLASALLVGGLAACGEHSSPTAPPVPTIERGYQRTAVQQGPAALIVNYDSTWSEQGARDVASQGLSDAMNLINMQTGTRGLVNIVASVYLQGPIPGIEFDTNAPAGLYRSGDGKIFCTTAPGALKANECIEHQLQHVYAQEHNCSRWQNVLHEDSRINTLNTPGFVADALMVNCEVTHDPAIMAYEIDRFHCDTDGKE